MDPRDEEELRAFDSTLQDRTTQLLNTVISISDGTRSLDSLILAIRCLGETNKDVVRVLLRSKDDIDDSQELFGLLKHYFSCSRKTLDFLNILEHWLNGANGVSWMLRRVKVALKEFKADKSKTGYGKTLLQGALRNFVSCSDAHVAEQLYAKLAAVLDERLLAKKREVDGQTERRFKLYRKVSTVILASLYMGLLVCAAVSAALSTMTPLQITTVEAIASVELTEHVGKWVDYMWRKYENKLRRRSELVNVLMQATSRITVEDLVGIRGAVQGLQEKFQRFSAKAGDAVALRKDPMVKSFVVDMEKKIDEFSTAIKDLQAKKDKCYRDVMDANGKIRWTTFGMNR